MNNNDLTKSDLHTSAGLCKSDANPSTAITPAGDQCQPRRRDQGGRYAPDPVEVAAREARLEVLRAEIEEACRAGQMPPSLVRLQQDELRLVVDALRTLTPALSPATAAGRISRQYRDYVTLVERAATLARSLGLNAADASKPKPWSKLTRAEQEAAAAAALEEVERNLGGSSVGDRNDDDEVVR
jgi:hypothetical protein